MIRRLNSMLYLSMFQNTWKRLRGWVYTKIELSFMYAFRVFRKLAFSSAGKDFASNSSAHTGLNGSLGRELGIVITTFEPRLHVFALPLIKSIREVTDTPITLVINGNYDGPANNESLKTLYSELAEIDHVYPVTFYKMVGCASLWNAGILHSDSKFSLILNDDISIQKLGLAADISSALAAMESEELITVNGSWSHFLIGQNLITQIGWFDENFLGFGWEDGDYLLRYLRHFKERPKNINLNSFINIVDDSRDPQVSTSWGKYSLFNREYYLCKYPEQITGANFDVSLKSSLLSDKSSDTDNLSFRTKFYPYLLENNSELISRDIELYFKSSRSDDSF